MDIIWKTLGKFAKKPVTSGLLVVACVAYGLLVRRSGHGENRIAKSATVGVISGLKHRALSSSSSSSSSEHEHEQERVREQVSVGVGGRRY